MMCAIGPRHAEVTLGPVADLRPVAEEEEQAEDGQREEEGEPGEGADPIRDAVLELRERCADRGARVLVGLRRGAGVDADVLEPALKRASGIAELAADVARLGRYAPDHDQEQADAHRDQAEHDENRAERARDPVTVHPPTSGEATAATTAAVITGATIVCVSDASHTRPIRSSATPTRSHDVRPMSLSQVGAAKTPVSSPASISTKSPSAGPSGRGRISLGVASPQASPDSHPGEPRPV